MLSLWYEAFIYFNISLKFRSSFLHFYFSFLNSKPRFQLLYFFEHKTESLGLAFPEGSYWTPQHPASPLFWFNFHIHPPKSAETIKGSSTSSSSPSWGQTVSTNSSMSECTFLPSSPSFLTPRCMIQEHSTKTALSPSEVTKNKLTARNSCNKCSRRSTSQPAHLQFDVGPHCLNIGTEWKCLAAPSLKGEELFGSHCQRGRLLVKLGQLEYRQLREGCRSCVAG